MLFRSPEFIELKEKWASNLYKLCNGLVKTRTVHCNYAPVYATMEYFYTVFRTNYNALGYTWENFLAWTKTIHVDQLQILHVQTDHAASYIRRFLIKHLPYTFSIHQ